MKAWYLLFSYLVVFTSCVQVQVDDGQFDVARMDSLFMHIEQHDKGMGSLSIFSNGTEVYNNTLGMANRELQLEPDAETKYRIGSISKIFTASIILQLVDEGVLQLNTPLSAYYPEIENAERITIEMLLQHRSGIFNFTSAPEYTSYMEQPITREGMLEKIKSNRNVFEPNARYEYSNSNYILLTLIAEKITGQAYATLVRQRVCEPCSLANTYYGGPISADRNEAQSYRKGVNGWGLATETDMSIPMGAGAIVSTPHDLNQFLNCLFTQPLISETSLNEMTNIADGYGLGVTQIPFGTKRAYGHDGGIDGFISMSYYFPQERVAVSYTGNGVDMAVNDILIGMLSIYFERNYTFPDFSPAISVTAEELEAYLGVYSSPSFPLKVTISKNENTLIAQAAGQSSFPLEAYGQHRFRFNPAGVQMEFKPEESIMVLQQAGRAFELKKE